MLHTLDREGDLVLETCSCLVKCHTVLVGTRLIAWQCQGSHNVCFGDSVAMRGQSTLHMACTRTFGQGFRACPTPFAIFQLTHQLCPATAHLSQPPAPLPASPALQASARGRAAASPAPRRARTSDEPGPASCTPACCMLAGQHLHTSQTDETQLPRCATWSLAGVCMWVRNALLPMSAVQQLRSKQVRSRVPPQARRSRV